MLETIFNLIGYAADDLHIDDNVLFCIGALIVLFCLGYVFNFFQILIERCTNKKGRF